MVQSCAMAASSSGTSAARQLLLVLCVLVAVLVRALAPAALLAVAGDPDAYPKQPNPLFALWSIGCIMGFTKSIAAARQRVRG